MLGPGAIHEVQGSDHIWARKFSRNVELPIQEYRERERKKKKLKSNATIFYKNFKIVVSPFLNGPSWNKKHADFFSFAFVVNPDSGMTLKNIERFVSL